MTDNGLVTEARTDGYSLGVDLGTTFVAAAISRNSQPEMIALGDRSVVSPSVVYLREDGAVVTADAANRRAVNSPERVARGFKRRLGDPTPVMLGGQPHSVVDLLGALLRDVLTRVTEIEGSPPDHVVLTHPANWGPFRRGLFEEVPLLVGLPRTRMMTEPEAAAAHYASTRRLNEGEIVAVYDLGGGTFDVTVVRQRADGIEILGVPEGIERLGGIDFDDAVLNYVNHVSNGALDQLDPRDPEIMMALNRLRQDCVLAKEALSIDTEVIVPLMVPGRHQEVHLSRADFEGLVRAQVESTIGALSRTLRSAQITPAELTAVLLVGGSSRIPLVARMVSEEFGRPTVVDTHPKYAVALGAAALADVVRSAERSAAGLSAGAGTDEPPRGTASPAAIAGLGGAGASVVAGAGSAGSTGGVPVTAADTAAHGVTHGVAPGSVATTAAAPTTAAGGGAATALSQAGRHGPAASRLFVSGAAPPGPFAAAPFVPGPTAAGPITGGPAGSKPRRSRAAVIAVAAGAVVIALIAGAMLYRGSGAPSIPATPPAATPPAAAAPPAAAVTTAITTGANPASVSFAPDGRHAFALNYSQKDGAVFVLDTAASSTSVKIAVPAGSNRAVFTPDGRVAYVTNFADTGVLSVIDTARNAVSATIAVPAKPNGLDISPDGRRIYLASSTPGVVSVLDTASNSITASIPVGKNPDGVAITPDGRRAYVTNYGSDTVSVIDTAANRVTATVRVENQPVKVAIAPDGRHAYVTNRAAGSVSVIDTATNAVTETVPVNRFPSGVAVTPDGRHVYVTNVGSGTVSVLDTATNAISATLPVGASPTDVAISPDGHSAYVADRDSGTVAVIHTG